MRTINFFILFFLSSWSNFNEVKKISSYYNIDSLLNSQIIILPNSNDLQKEVTWNSKSEKSNFSPRNFDWQKELNVFNQIDINQVSNKSLYEVLSKDNLIEYKKLVDEEGIISIEITFDSNDKPKSIVAYGIKKNFLFNSYRNYNLSFDSIGNLTNYLFEDKQIRIFNDTLLYKVYGNIIW